MYIDAGTRLFPGLSSERSTLYRALTQRAASDEEGAVGSSDLEIEMGTDSRRGGRTSRAKGRLRRTTNVY